MRAAPSALVPLFWLLWWRPALTLTINRHHKGDMLVESGPQCGQDLCDAHIARTADAECACQCPNHLPVFRDDLLVCVDDIHECTLAPFVSGSVTQRMPFVFLPLEGQIVYPSAEISFPGVKTPVCVVSGSQFMSRKGWTDLRSGSHSEPPFRLFRDEGRTYLQWLGESSLRLRMEGHLILVKLLCRDASGDQDQQQIFSPCVAFRVAGTPRQSDDVAIELSFSGDLSGRGGLSPSEYVAIGVCSLLLGLVYVASVLLYLHARRRRSEKDKVGSAALASVDLEHGIVKNNPLLLHRGISSDCLTDTCCESDTEDSAPPSDDGSVKVTSAIIHSYKLPSPKISELYYAELPHIQENSSIERLPEENVSIVETMECREERPETVRGMMNGVARRKLYFNPAYFEPELLIAPPPAAIEFLTKIREVISIAKHKMAAKRFSPSLVGIPEEDGLLYITGSQIGSKITGSTISEWPRGYSLKRENSRRRGCTGCPTCQPINLSDSNCQTCSTTGTSTSSSPQTKERSIRKWLEDLPAKPETSPPVVSPLPPCGSSKQFVKRLAPSIPKTNGETSRQQSKINETKMPKAIPISVKSVTSVLENNDNIEKPLKSPNSIKVLKVTDIKTFSDNLCPTPPPLPPEIKSEELHVKPIRIKNRSEAPVATKHLMDAVIKELSVKKKLETRKSSNGTVSETVTKTQRNEKSEFDFEVDSLERSLIVSKIPDERGLSTPTDYGDITLQRSPSLSSGLPLEEELTMRNEIFNIQTGSTTISKLKPVTPKTNASDEHEYEIILMNSEEKQETKSSDLKILKLPELLSSNEGYSLVSEVYVNDGYSFSSPSSSPSNISTTSSSCSSGPKIRYDQPDEKPGHLTIEVEDSPQNYIPDDSDSFEPDTLDRKPSKRLKSDSITIQPRMYKQINETYNDSLERPAHILLKTTGSFKSDTMSQCGSLELIGDSDASPFRRAFGSLRELYEARAKSHFYYELENSSFVGSAKSLHSDPECDHSLSWKCSCKNSSDSLTRNFSNRELKLSKRQRCPSPVSNRIQQYSLPPDVIPPLPPKTQYLYQEPLPPRPVQFPLRKPKEVIPPLPPRNIKPPLPPKNVMSRSTRIGPHLARRPLPPLPRPDCLPHDSTLSSTSSSCDPETLSIVSGASVDSLNSSDYEAFYNQPDVHPLGLNTEEKLVSQKEQPKFIKSINLDETKTEHSCSKLVSKETSVNIRNNCNDIAKSVKNINDSKQRLVKDLGKLALNKRSSESVKKAWRRVVDRPSGKVLSKPEDSGYLSTDSNDSNRPTVLVQKQVQAPVIANLGQGSLSETDESLCDGASESGGESIATDSFFFGSFKKLSKSKATASSVDSGVDSDLMRTLNNSHISEDIIDSSSDSEKMSLASVRHSENKCATPLFN